MAKKISSHPVFQSLLSLVGLGSSEEKAQPVPDDDGLEKFEAWLKENTRPCIYMHKTLALNSSKSFVGGIPYLPAGVEWPLNSEGESAQFLAQIDLSELPVLETESFPREGVLFFFYDSYTNGEGSHPSPVLYADAPGAVEATPPESVLSLGVNVEGEFVGGVERANLETDRHKRFWQSYILPKFHLGFEILPSIAPFDFNHSLYLEYKNSFFEFWQNAFAETRKPTEPELMADVMALPKFHLLSEELDETEAVSAWPWSWEIIERIFCRWKEWAPYGIKDELPPGYEEWLERVRLADHREAPASKVRKEFNLWIFSTTRMLLKQSFCGQGYRAEPYEL